MIWNHMLLETIEIMDGKISYYLIYIISNCCFVDFMICHWRHCGQQLPADFDKFTRHSLYHTFHTKLKSIAPLVKKASKLEHNCMLDRASVNLIPDLPEQFICGWEDCKVEIHSIKFLHFVRNDYVLV